MASHARLEKARENEEDSEMIAGIDERFQLLSKPYEQADVQSTATIFQL